MIQQYRKPSVKFIVNKGNFNKLMTLLNYQEENIVTKEWKEKANDLKEILLKYSVPQKDEDGEIAIIDISLYQNEASDLIILLLSAFCIVLKDEDIDYTHLMKRKK